MFIAAASEYSPKNCASYACDVVIGVELTIWFSLRMKFLFWRTSGDCLTAVIKKLSFVRRILTALIGAAMRWESAEYLAFGSTAFATPSTAICSEASDAGEKSSC